jgi:hypothetical protein
MCQIKSEDFLVDINSLLNAGDMGGNDDVAAWKKWWLAGGCIGRLLAWSDVCGWPVGALMIDSLGKNWWQFDLYFVHSDEDKITA